MQGEVNSTPTYLAAIFSLPFFLNSDKNKALVNAYVFLFLTTVKKDKAALPVTDIIFCVRNNQGHLILRTYGYFVVKLYRVVSI